jgi:hypothetical protein
VSAEQWVLPATWLLTPGGTGRENSTLKILHLQLSDRIDQNAYTVPAGSAMQYAQTIAENNLPCTDPLCSVRLALRLRCYKMDGKQVLTF